MRVRWRAWITAAADDEQRVQIEQADE